MRLPKVITSTKDGAEAVLVPAGEFPFGVSQQELRRLLDERRLEFDPVFETELPRRIAEIKDCYIDRFPVTNRRYARFMQATGHRAPQFWGDPRWNGPERPVVGITCLDAESYARWAGKRLPTEEEWERAARGSDDRIWPWGDDFHSQRCNCKEWGVGRTTDVSRFPGAASPVGAMDMAGNVWELTSGKWEVFSRSIRGGSYMNSIAFCRCTCRWGVDPDLAGSTWLGFRCVMDLAKARLFGRAVTGEGIKGPSGAPLGGLGAGPAPQS